MGLIDGAGAEILWVLEGFFLVLGAVLLVGALIWVNLVVWRRILRGLIERPSMVTAPLVRPTSLDLRGRPAYDMEMQRSPRESVVIQGILID